MKNYLNILLSCSFLPCICGGFFVFYGRGWSAAAPCIIHCNDSWFVYYYYSYILTVYHSHFTTQFPWYCSCSPLLSGPRLSQIGGFFCIILIYLDRRVGGIHQYQNRQERDVKVFWKITYVCIHLKEPSYLQFTFDIYCITLKCPLCNFHICISVHITGLCKE